MTEAEINLYVIDTGPTPGPSDYSVPSDMGSGRKWSIKDRFERPTEHHDPWLVNVKSTIGQGIKCALSSRHPPPTKFNPPGPNFLPPPFYKAAPQINFPHGKAAPIRITPGPPDYHITPDSIKATGTSSPRPAVREGGPRKMWDPVEPTPGPGALYVRHERVQTRSPRWTIKQKGKDRAHEPTGEYVGQRSTFGGRKCGFSHAGRPAIAHR
jgi:hypothetical protein